MTEAHSSVSNLSRVDTPSVKALSRTSHILIRTITVLFHTQESHRNHNCL